MLIGKYYHRLEAQNRLSLPKKFRQETEEWIVTRGLDGCLFLFPTETFATELAKISERSLTKKTNRDLVRLMANEAEELTPDALGRIHLPEYLTEYAHLTKEIVIVGSIRHLEVWDQTHYHEYVTHLESTAEAIAEATETHD